MGRVADLERSLNRMEKQLIDTRAPLAGVENRLDTLKSTINGLQLPLGGKRIPGLSQRVDRVEHNLERYMGGDLEDFCEKCGKPLAPEVSESADRADGS